LNKKSSLDDTIIDIMNSYALPKEIYEDGGIDENELFVVQAEGETLGPFQRSRIVALIQEYPDETKDFETKTMAETSWSSIVSHPLLPIEREELEEAFIPPIDSIPTSKATITLLRRGIAEGPFTVEQINHLLDKKEALYVDQISTDGGKSFSPIHSVQEFNRQGDKENLPMSPEDKIYRDVQATTSHKLDNQSDNYQTKEALAGMAYIGHLKMGRVKENQQIEAIENAQHETEEVQREEEVTSTVVHQVDQTDDDTTKVISNYEAPNPVLTFIKKMFAGKPPAQEENEEQKKSSSIFTPKVFMASLVLTSFVFAYGFIKLSQNKYVEKIAKVIESTMNENSDKKESDKVKRTPASENKQKVAPKASAPSVVKKVETKKANVEAPKKKKDKANLVVPQKIQKKSADSKTKNTIKTNQSLSGLDRLNRLRKLRTKRKQKRKVSQNQYYDEENSDEYDNADNYAEEKALESRSKRRPASTKKRRKKSRDEEGDDYDSENVEDEYNEDNEEEYDEEEIISKKRRVKKRRDDEDDEEDYSDEEYDE
jgi:hypothetical protein